MKVAKLIVNEDKLLDFLGYRGGEIRGVRIDDVADGVVFLIKHDTLANISHGHIIPYVEKV